jgi:hypothetical protein
VRIPQSNQARCAIEAQGCPCAFAELGFAKNVPSSAKLISPRSNAASKRADFNRVPCLKWATVSAIRRDLDNGFGGWSTEHKRPPMWNGADHRSQSQGLSVTRGSPWTRLWSLAARMVAGRGGNAPVESVESLRGLMAAALFYRTKRVEMARTPIVILAFSRFGARRRPCFQLGNVQRRVFG